MKRRRRRKHEPAQPPEAPWRQLVVDAAAVYSTPLESVLLEEGALGIETVDDQTRAMPGSPSAPTGRVTLIVPFAREPGLEQRVVAQIGRTVLAVERDLGPANLELAWNDLHAEDWTAAFKASWQPLELCPGCFVVPSWIEDFDDERAEIVLELDPGLAFGTGLHPTTRLCAAALREAAAALELTELLDVGTGTAVLSLLALKLGVGSATGTDVDPIALKAAEENAALNGMGDRFTTSGSAPDKLGRQFSACVANILAGPLLELAPAIAAAVTPGGRLWLSGLLEDQAESLTRAYTAAGFKLLGRATSDGWVRLDLERVPM